MNFTNNEMFDMLDIYFTSHKNCSLAANTYHVRYPERQAPSRKFFKKIVENLKNNGSFKTKKQRPKLIVNEDVEIDILSYFETNPTSSIRQAVQILNVSFSSVQKVLRKYKYTPYKPTVHQALMPGDEDRRLEFCSWLAEEATQSNQFLSSIIWTDETNFSNKGMYNRKNNYFWSTKNPLIVREGNPQVRFSFNCWCALLKNRILAVHFYQGNLNGALYTNEILENVLLPAIDDLSLHQRNQLIFQQDGAPAHNIEAASDFLNNHFPNGWMATYGPIRWPARSPDLTPMDFFLWGFIKDNLYKDRYNSAEEMMNKITQLFNDIHHTVIAKAVKDVYRRAHACIYVDGRHFEHLL